MTSYWLRLGDNKVEDLLCKYTIKNNAITLTFTLEGEVLTKEAKMVGNKIVLLNSTHTKTADVTIQSFHFLTHTITLEYYIRYRKDKFIPILLTTSRRVISDNIPQDILMLLNAFD